MKRELTDQEKEIEAIIMSRVMRLNAIVNGVVFGIVFGLLLFGATIFLVLKGGPVVGPNLSLLGEVLIGYSVTWWGSIVGFIYGFLLGFAAGYFIALVYNKVVEIRGRGKIDSKPSS